EKEESIASLEKKEKAVPILREEKPVPVPEEKPGFLSGLLRKVTKKVTEKTLTEEEIDKFLGELQRALLENDVSLETAERICDDVKQQLKGRSVRRGEAGKEINHALRSAMLDVMQQPGLSIEQLIENKYGETNQPLLVVFFGFNGTGKTTTIAKLAHRLKKYKPVIAAGDTFRAASIEQLEEHGRRLGVEVVKHRYGADSAAVIFDAVKHASSAGSKIVLADTAGRSHSNVNLMDELKKVVRVNKPDLRVLVLDALTGNDIYDQSVLFEKAAGVDAVILTKVDVYERGGAALSATHTLKKPVLFLGVGQEYDDLKEFKPEEIVKNLLE
ncbi:MAG: signal recognition particle-docking protein FtsY, partial [Candidatus Aenigmarchaeota archaeon]|nr:signal recognition particle-docking protein FtsY [Candidatus Aenigmarchaeota archaeon]